MFLTLIYLHLGCELEWQEIRASQRADPGVGKVCLVTWMRLIIPWRLMEDKATNMQSLNESAQNNDFIWNMPHAHEFGFERWVMIFIWSYCVFQPSVNKLPPSCNFWNKFLCSVWSSPHCIRKKKKRNTGPNSAKNNPCSCTAWALWVSCSLKIFIQFLKGKYLLSSSHREGY